MTSLWVTRQSWHHYHLICIYIYCPTESFYKPSSNTDSLLNKRALSSQPGKIRSVFTPEINPIGGEPSTLLGEATQPWSE